MMRPSLPRKSPRLKRACVWRASNHAGKAFEGKERLALVGPFLQLIDADVIARLAACAGSDERARDVDHLRCVCAFIGDGRAALVAEATHVAAVGFSEARDVILTLQDAEAAAPTADIGGVGAPAWARRELAL